MHDDHFGPIEQPYQIISDYSVWADRGSPHGHSIVYPAAHYYLFLGLNSVGISDPQDKMYVVRFLHALYSLLTVFFGYKIARILADEKVAWKVGLMLALLWLMPFFGVRNLVEMVCVPPIMAAFYFSIRDKARKYDFVLVGALFAAAFIFRPQTLILPFGMGLVLLLQKKFIQTAQLAVGLLVTAFLTQGMVDWVAWGYPFAAFLEYFVYNASHGEDYSTGPWWRYLALTIGILIPPFSLLLFYGFLRTWKKYLLLFLPVALFFAFHSYFPNKQERFIMPVIPMIAVLAVVGWELFVRDSVFWKKHTAWLKGLTIWFWAVNSILLILFTFTYSKKTRVESLYYLSKKSDVEAVFIYGGNLGANYPPTFYLNKQVPVYATAEEYSAEEMINKFQEKGKMPNYAIFFGVTAIEKNKADFEDKFNAKLAFETEITPSITDDLLYKLNPKGNKNQTANIYRIEY